METFGWYSCRNLVFMALFLQILPWRVQAAGIPPEDIKPMISALHVTGHHLLANAIQLSDIQNLILSGNSCTIFAPTDEALLRLHDLNFIDVVKYHIVILKFSFYDLSRLPTGSKLYTLLQDKSIALTANYSLPAEDGSTVMVDDARITAPDLYNNYRISVHGIDRLLNHSVYGNAPPTGSANGEAAPVGAPSVSFDPSLHGLYPEVNLLPTILPYPRLLTPSSAPSSEADLEPTLPPPPYTSSDQGPGFESSDSYPASSPKSHTSSEAKVGRSIGSGNHRHSRRHHRHHGKSHSDHHVQDAGKKSCHHEFLHHNEKKH